MAKKDTTRTPRSRIRAALRQLSLRSRERATALKIAERTCKICNRKASVAKGRELKVEAHHTCPPKWEELIDLIITEVLQRPEDYMVLCKECHRKEHDV